MEKNGNCLLDKKEVKNNKNRGITLVALVITIIVLLILAGITISLILGDNGLLNRAEAGKNAHERGEANDINTLDRATDYMNSYFTGAGGSKLTETEKKALEDNNIEEKKKDEIKNENLKDNDNIKAVITGEVPIPKGFCYKEGIIETGIVITDNKNENEFVWIPVENIEEMAVKQDKSDVNYQGVIYDYTKTEDSIIAEKMQTGEIESGSGYREPDIVNDVNWADGNVNNLAIMNNILGTTYTMEQFKKVMQEDYNDMVQSVIKYKGFYIGRYETSVDVANKRAYSRVNELPLTAENASSWYGLYAYEKIMASKNEYTTVKSHMIWGSNYDAMINWILNGDDKEKVMAIGNAPHNLTEVYKTGSQPNDKINNIYDLEGNGVEWTAEAYGTDGRGVRGGSYSESYFPVHHSYGFPYYTGANLISRLLLYII